MIDRVRCTRPECGDESLISNRVIQLWSPAQDQFKCGKLCSGSGVSGSYCVAGEKCDFVLRRQRAGTAALSAEWSVAAAPPCTNTCSVTNTRTVWPSSTDPCLSSYKRRGSFRYANRAFIVNRAQRTYEMFPLWLLEILKVSAIHIICSRILFLTKLLKAPVFYKM